MSTKTIIKNYTTGSILRNLLLFSWPLILSNLLMTAYNLVDMVVVGQMIGTVGMSAVSIGTDVVHFYLLVGMGLCSAGQVLISQYVGVRNREAISRIVGTMFTVVLLMGAAVTVIGLLLNRFWTQILNVPEAAVEGFLRYVSCCTLGMLFSYGYSMVSAILRGLGDSKLPMIIIATSSVINIVLDILFVKAGLGVLGAALATVLAQGISFLAALAYLWLRRDMLGFELRPRDFLPEKKSLSLLFSLGVPMLLQSGAVSVSTLYISGCINVYGVVVSAVTGVGAKLSTISGIICMALGQSSSVIVGQNFAARQFKRVSQTVLWAVVINVCFSGILSIWLALRPEQIFSLFNDSPEVLAMSHSYVLIAVLNFFGAAVRGPSMGLCNGMGFPRLNFIMGIVDGIVMRIGLSYLLGSLCGLGLRGYWLGSALAGYAFFFVMGPYFISGRWKKRAPPAVGSAG